MGWPTIECGIDVTNPPLTSFIASSFSNRAAHLLRFAIRRGRQNELNRVEAGTAVVTLDNDTRIYNPLTNPVSPSLAGIQPMRKLRIRATYDAQGYALFLGFVESWQPQYSRAIDSEAVLRCVDAFKYFSLAKLDGSYSSALTSAAIGSALDLVDWPAADRSLSTGQSQIQAGSFNQTPALTHFRNIEGVENGLFFIDAQGRPTFHDRFWRLTNSASSVVTFGDALDGSETPFLSFTAAFDDTFIWNQAVITRQGGSAQKVNDTASQDEFFLRTYSATLPLLTDNEAQSLAEWFVSRYAQPFFRFTSVTLDGAMSDALWPHILGRAIGDRITVRTRVIDPAGLPTDDYIEQECYIEGVAHDVDPDRMRWLTTFQLSPADALTYWILEHAVYGVLGSTTRLAY